MTVFVTHAKIATLPDEPGAEVNKAEWNDNHVIVGLGSAAEAATTDFDAAGVATAAVAAHVAAGDPHPQYLTAAEGNAAYDATGAATAAVATHVGLADPHTQYQKESEKDAANGYAGLSAGTKLAGTQQTYGSLANTACEGNDARLSDARAPNGVASGDLAGSYPSPTVTQARGLRETTGPTTLAMGAVADGEFLKRSGSSVIGGSPGAASLTLTTVEVNLGTISRRGGKFNITTSGLTSGKAVSIMQANGPYTGKGSRTDEAEMDGLTVSGKTTSATNIECFWHTRGFVKGNVKFDYVVGA
jgi:hypothetical protein